jgi:hypothetical protein
MKEEIMNRKQRRKVGDVIFTQTVKVASGEFYWFESPDFRRRDVIPSGAVLYGPFRSYAEVHENQRLILLGPDCEITEARSKPH